MVQNFRAIFKKKTFKIKIAVATLLGSFEQKISYFYLQHLVTLDLSETLSSTSSSSSSWCLILATSHQVFRVFCFTFWLYYHSVQIPTMAREQYYKQLFCHIFFLILVHDQCDQIWLNI